MVSLTIPFFSLVIGGLIIWLLVESFVHWFFKIIGILTICALSIVLFLSFKTFLGWPSDSNMPEKVSIRSVVIKEPNPSLSFKGKIYFLLDSVKSKYDNKMLDLLGHQNETKEPRLFSVPYSRELHEELQKNVVPKLKEGQVVQGLMKKLGKQGKQGGKGNKNGKNSQDGESGQANSMGNKNGNGKGNENKNDNGGSESQEQEYMFYNLPPSLIQPKNPRPEDLNK